MTERLNDVDARSQRILSICAGGGGLDLGVHLASQTAHTVCYVEREAFAIAVLAEAIQNQALDDAPIWTDLLTFDGKPWRGVVDTIIGGIPCQPHSVAGLQRGADDDRDLWPVTARIIAEVRPGAVFLENVPGIMGYYHERIGPELRAMGYHTEEGLFSAAEVGASHQRQRFFVLAHRDGEQSDLRRGGLREESDTRSEDVAHRDGRRCREFRFTRRLGEMGESKTNISIQATQCDSCDVADADQSGLQERPSIRADYESERQTTKRNSVPRFAPFRDDDDGWARLLAEMPEVEPAFCGIVHGVADRVHQIRVLGNGVVPLTAALAFTTLARRAGIDTTQHMAGRHGLGVEDG